MDVKNASPEQLKAFAYDLLIQIKTCQQNLKFVEDEIVKRNVVAKEPEKIKGDK